MNANNANKAIKLEKKSLSIMGPDVVLYIPRSFIKYKLLDIDKLYDIIFVELDEKKQDKKREIKKKEINKQ